MAALGFIMTVNVKRALAKQTRGHQPEMVHLLPESWLADLINTYQLDKWSKKLFFTPFIRFLLLIILKQTKKISLRHLSFATKDPYYQRATGIESVEFSNIGQRLRKIPRKIWAEVFQYCYRVSQTTDKRFKKFVKLLKWFDTTTISMSAKRCKWAAKNGVKKALRVTLRIDDRTDRIEFIVNGSANTSDNTIFRQLLVNIKRGAILVFDAGFTNLTIIKELVTRGYHFVSVKSATMPYSM